MGLRKGIRVTTTGVGRTSTWGKNKGTVTKVKGKSVFVNWDNTHFEDQMSNEEVKKLKVNKKL